MDRNVRFAMILFAAVMLIHIFVVMPLFAPKPDKQAPAQEAVPADTAIESAPVSQKAPAPADVPPAEPKQEQAGPKPPHVVDTGEVIETQTVTLISDQVELNLTNRGAAIERILLPKYQQPTDTNTLQLVETVPEEPPIFAMRVNPEDYEEYISLPFKVVDQSNTKVVFARPIFENVRLVKTFSLREGEYLIDVEIKFENDTDQPVDLAYELAGPHRIESESYQVGSDISAAYLNTARNNKLKSISMRSVGKSASAVSLQNANWCGLVNSYFACLVKTPGHDKVKNALFSAIRDNDQVVNIAVTFESARATVPAKDSITQQFTVFCGPKDRQVLERTPELAKLIPYGLFAFLSRIVMAILVFFHGVVQNWGVAILMLTILVRLCLFPLTRKSLVQTQRMQALQPELKKIQEKHKNNKQKLAEEQMKLWRKHGANPMSGCLMPLLIQMPVFFALFRALRNSIELRKAPFCLWITDLSRPDCLFEVPFWPYNLRLLPVLSGVLMILSQWMSQRNQPPPADEQAAAQQKQQKSMMIMMSVVFLFMLYNFASGLMLYWTMSSLWGMGEQWFIRRHLSPAPGPAASPGSGRKPS